MKVLFEEKPDRGKWTQEQGDYMMIVDLNLSQVLGGQPLHWDTGDIGQTVRLYVHLTKKEAEWLLDDGQEPPVESHEIEDWIADNYIPGFELNKVTLMTMEEFENDTTGKWEPFTKE